MNAVSPDETPPKLPDPWDSTLFVLTGGDRKELLRRIQDFKAELESSPNVSLKKLASGTLRDFERSGQKLRIGMVAESREQLVRHVDRALERISNPKCGRIREVTGLYFEVEPIYEPGSLAFVCPGEGAQYDGMLVGLPDAFPGVREIYQQCRSLASAKGGPGLRMLDQLFFGDEASQDTTMTGDFSADFFGVVIGNWVYSEIARLLSLEPDFVGGHSAGEMSALCLAGVIGDKDVVGLANGIYAMSDGVEKGSAVLLALGTSREKAEAIVAETELPVTEDGNPSAFVAMDNCPHQAVIVGLPSSVALVETVLKRKGLIYERLEIDRPYHTPLFEPFMSPIRDMFRHVQFESPRYNIYSCTSAKPFPEDADAMRALSVEHWVSTVEFAKLIRQMYADGARVFVEIGPRGNLSSFIEDILRGKPFVAIPMNVMRNPQITQIQHVMARLIVHGVPLDLGSLDERKRHDSDDATKRATHWDTSATDTSKSQSVMEQYQSLMHQFLQVQQDVMQDFLAVHKSGDQRRRRAVRSWLRQDRGLKSRPAPTVVRPALPDQSNADQGNADENDTVENDTVASIERKQTRDPSSSDRALSILQQTSDFPLLAEPIELDANSLRIQRRLELDAEPYADHHTVGGQRVSRVDPSQHGLPVMPMTFTLETLAEAASKLVPGMVVVSLRDVRLQRWLAFYVEDPVTIELQAEVISIDEIPRPLQATLRRQDVVVRVRVHDLGNSGIGPGAQGGDAASGWVVLAPSFPAPPLVEEMELTNPRPFHTSWNDLYDNLFHGPLFQGVLSLDQYGDRQVEGTVAVLPRQGLFRGNDMPQFLQDPVTMDTAMHTLAAWHVEQPDQNGRIMLPFSLDRVDFFAPCPKVGERFRCQGRLRKETPRYVVQDLDVLDSVGSLRWRMRGIRLWRFYLPFDGVNFHGPKDVYFLSSEWPEVAPNENTVCVRFDVPDDLLQPAILWAASKVALTPREQATFVAMRGTDRENALWVLSRGACKDATRKLFLKRENLKMFPADIEIDDRSRDQWRTYPRSSSSELVFPQVAYAEQDGRFVALAALEGIPFVVSLPRDHDASDSAQTKEVIERLVEKVSQSMPIQRVTRDSSARTAFHFHNDISTFVTVTVSDHLVVAACCIPDD